MAAYANSNIITYPAIYSSTVGVIADRYHTVNQGEILYLNNNNYVAHNEKKFDMDTKCMKRGYQIVMQHL